jgi:hypothetical protein
MESSTEASVLEALEQAEMAARERRLAASSQAERIVTAARQRAAAIDAQAGRRVEDALDRLRSAAEASADAAIADLERVAEEHAAGRRERDDDRRARQAVALVVAHLLGEVSSEAADGGQG